MLTNAMVFIPSKYKYLASLMQKYVFPPIVLTRPLAKVMSDDMLEQQFFSELLRKNPHLGDPKQLEKVTVDGFIETEQRCYNYNSQFEKLINHPWLGDVLRLWKENLGIILYRPFIKRVPLKVTSGATTSCKRGNVPLERFKHSEITHELSAYLSTNPEFGMPFGANPKVINGCISFQVPKSVDVNRLAAKEAAENMLLQSDVGLQLSALLAESGIVIKTAQDVHKAYAWLASQTGEFTTDDLKSASNLLYRALCQYLLPPSWREVTDAARSTHIFIDGEWRELQCYAPNGNGFCFELETAIFYAMLQTAHMLVHQTWSEDCRVYGDDLIYPTSITDTVRRICKGVGFITNIEKSFSTGFFRESCGGDFINGTNVRPIYLKSKLESSFEKIIHLNQIYARFPTRMPKYIRKYYFAILRSIPVEDRYYGPPTASGALHFPKFWKDKPSKWGVSRYREFRYTAVDQTSFGHIVHGMDPHVALQLAAGGFCRGQGAHRLKQEFTTSGVDHAVLQQLRLRPANGSNYTVKYNFFPSAGARLIETRERSIYFYASQDADPNAVLDKLKESGLPLLQPSYYRKVIRPKIAREINLRRELINKLKELVERKRNVYAVSSDDIVLDF